MQSNVIEHPATKWADLRALYDKEQEHHAAARAYWPRIASRMADLRNDYKSDNDFGAALVQHGIEYNKNDRAAFIWMGQLKPAALEDALARCERRSPQHFRAEVESWQDDYFQLVSSVRKPESNNVIPADSAESDPMEAETMTTPDQETPKTDTPISTFKADPRSTLAQLPPAAGAMFHSALGGNMKHGAKRVIDQLIAKKPARPFLLWWAARLADGEARDPLVKNDGLLNATHIVPNLDKTFRDYCVVFDGLFHKKEADRLVEEFDALRAAGAGGLSLIEYQRQRNSKQALQRAQEPATQTEPQKDAVLSDGTVLHPQPIVVAGHQIFPHANREGLTYEDAMVYAHMVRDYVVEPRLASGKTLENIGREVALMGTHCLGRHHQPIGQYLSAMGQLIRNAKCDPAHLFQMEPLAPKTCA